MSEVTVTITAGHVDKMPTCKHGRVEGFCQCWQKDALLCKLRADRATDLSDETIERIFKHTVLPLTCIRYAKGLRDCGDLTEGELSK